MDKNEEGNYSIEASLVMPIVFILVILIVNVTIYVFNNERINLMCFKNDLKTFEYNPDSNDQKINENYIDILNGINNVEVNKMY